MRKFVRKLTLFLLPVGLFFLPAWMLLWRSGEISCSPDSLILGHRKYLAGFQFQEKKYRYLKLRSLELLPRMNIIAIGSSRALQFRPQMFIGTFYNAGYTIQELSGVRGMLQLLPEKKRPAAIIVPLDQWMFNANWTPVPNDPAQWEKEYSELPDGRHFFSLNISLIRGKQSFDLVQDGEMTFEGLWAHQNKAGIRSDGSMDYGNVIDRLAANDSTLSDFGFRDTFARIDRGDMLFEHGSRVDEQAMRDLYELLAYCKQSGIKVIGFLPPFAKAVNQRLDQKGNHTYMNLIFSKIQPVFKKHGFECFDMQHPETFGATDREMLDGFHAGEAASARMLLEMSRQSREVAKLINVEQIKSRLQSHYDSFRLFPY